MPQQTSLQPHPQQQIDLETPKSEPEPPKPQEIDKVKAQREWKHILVGAMALAATAGYINSVVLDFFDIPVSHVTGAISRLGNDVARHQPHPLNALLVIVGFLAGTTLAGLFIGAVQILPSRRYAAIMMIESVLLFISAYLLDNGSVYGPMMASIACGLQNGMTTSYCGLMIRTTHMTGLMTDIGLMIGHWMRHKAIAKWKLKFNLCILFSFFGGGVFGTWVGVLYGHWCMAIAASVCFFLGLIFFTIMQQEINSQSDQEDSPSDRAFPKEA